MDCGEHKEVEMFGDGIEETCIDGYMSAYIDQ